MKFLVSVSSAVLAVGLLAGCTSTVFGVAQRSAGGPGPGEVDRSQLNPGNYPTAPAPPVVKAKTPQSRGAAIEGRRMANNVVGPWDVDPAMVKPVGALAASVILNPDVVSLFHRPGVDEIVKRHNFIVGYHMARGPVSSPTRSRELLNTVFRFATPDDAAAATAELAEMYRSAGDPAQPIPNHPETAAFSSSGLEGRVLVTAFTAHGPYVFDQTATTGNLDESAQLVAALLDKQAPLIDAFVPTDPAAFPDLPVDPTGILAKTLPLEETTVNDNAVYEPVAAQAQQFDPIRAAKVFADAGVQAMSTSKTAVYPLSDAAALQRGVDGFGGLADAVLTSAEPAASVPGLPNSVCFRDAAPDAQDNYCVSGVDRYVFTANSAQLPDAHQQMAAQYLILTAR